MSKLPKYTGPAVSIPSHNSAFWIRIPKAPWTIVENTSCRESVMGELYRADNHKVITKHGSLPVEIDCFPPDSDDDEEYDYGWCYECSSDTCECWNRVNTYVRPVLSSDLGQLELVLNHTVGLISVLHTKEPLVDAWIKPRTPCDFGYRIPAKVHYQFPALTHLLLKIIRDAPYWPYEYLNVTDNIKDRLANPTSTLELFSIFDTLFPNLCALCTYDLSQLPSLLREGKTYPMIGYDDVLNDAQYSYNTPSYWSEI